MDIGSRRANSIFFQTIYHMFTPYCKVNFFKGICKNKNNIVSISKICCQLRHLVILFKNRIKGTVCTVVTRRKKKSRVFVTLEGVNRF